MKKQQRQKLALPLYLQCSCIHLSAYSNMKGVCAFVCLLAMVSVNASWLSGHNAFFDGKSEKQIKQLMGYDATVDVKLPQVVYEPMDIPDSFDSRTQWPNCASIGTIQNQAECGSCWAFGAVESITDRFCIHNNNDTQLSFQDMTSCNILDHGCEGGSASSAYFYAKYEGLVSAACYPYSIPTCPPAQQPCLNFVKTPKCERSCNTSAINYKDDKHKLSSAYSVSEKNNGIEQEIMTNGPVEACFQVYQDFVGYKSGVYSYTNGTLLGGHCIKILGFGVDNGVDYWIVANSWTTYWGNEGYFWIKRGVNECGIESGVVAGLP